MPDDLADMDETFRKAIEPDPYPRRKIVYIQVSLRNTYPAYKRECYFSYAELPKPDPLVCSFCDFSCDAERIYWLGEMAPLHVCKECFETAGRIKDIRPWWLRLLRWSKLV